MTKARGVARAAGEGYGVELYYHNIVRFPTRAIANRVRRTVELFKKQVEDGDRKLQDGAVSRLAKYAAHPSFTYWRSRQIIDWFDDVYPETPNLF